MAFAFYCHLAENELLTQEIEEDVLLMTTAQLTVATTTSSISDSLPLVETAERLEESWELNKVHVHERVTCLSAIGC